MKHSDAYYQWRVKKILTSEMNNADRLQLTLEFLSLIKEILVSAYKNYSTSGKLDFKALDEFCFNYSLEDGSSREKRVAPETIIRNVMVHFRKDCKFIFIEILESSEKKGEFYEKRLFISEYAQLAIVEVWFRLEQSSDRETSEINEIVHRTEIIKYEDEGFKVALLPYMTVELFKKIVVHKLDPIIFEVKRIEKLLEGPREFLRMTEKISF